MPLKIAAYCQHVLGMGHFFRSLEILKALSRHQVLLITGGKRVQVSLPPHITHYALPTLMMDAGFKQFQSDESLISLEAIKKKRRHLLKKRYNDFAPDIFLIELYPFGRKAFEFELLPILKDIRKGKGHRSRVICSLRDILVEKEDPAAYENRVLERLNTYFDELIIHSDPTVIPIERTFSKAKDITIPVYYSGFISRSLPRKKRKAMRDHYGVAENEHLIIVSCGGGNIGTELLESCAIALEMLSRSEKIKGILISGPFMEDKVFRKLLIRATPSIKVYRFREDFTDLLTAADLSISMAGYNTMMDIVSRNLSALVYPFSQNQEQCLRVKLFSQFSHIKKLRREDLQVDQLIGMIKKQLVKRKGDRRPPEMDIQGSLFMATHIERE